MGMMKRGTTSGLFAPLSDLLYPSDAPAQWIKAFQTRQGRGQYQYFPMVLTDAAVFEVNKPAMKAGNFHNGRGTNSKITFSGIWNFEKGTYNTRNIFK